MGHPLVAELEKEIGTHSRILAWRIPRTEEPSGLQCIISQRVDTTERLIQQEQQQQGYTQQNLGNKKFYRKKKIQKKRGEATNTLKST